MSYTRDPDHYTRGVGAVQAVDKVLARQRGVARARRDVAIESARRDQQKRKLLRQLGLGAVMLPNFGRPGVSMAPVVTSGGVVEGGGTIGGGGAVNAGGTFGSGGGGGGVSPTNGTLKGRTYTIATNLLNQSQMQSTRPASVGICVDAMGNKIPCPPPNGTNWNPNAGIVPPTYVPPAPGGGGTFTNIGGNAGTSSGTTSSGSGTAITPVTTTDPGTVPTSTVGASSGGSSGGGSAGSSSGGGGGIVDAGPTDDSGAPPILSTTSSPNYALYAGIGLAALLLYSLSKGR